MLLSFCCYIPPSTAGAAVRDERRVATDIHQQRERVPTVRTGRVLLRGGHAVGGACPWGGLRDSDQNSVIFALINRLQYSCLAVLL